MENRKAALSFLLLAGAAVVWWARRPSNTFLPTEPENEPQLDVVTQSKSYRGYVVLRAEPTSQPQLEALTAKALAPLALGVDFWKEARAVGTPVVMMFNASAAQIARSHLDLLGIAYKVMIPDVQAAVDASQSRGLAKQQDSGFFQDYHRFDEITAWMEAQASAQPDMATMFEVGNSIENRLIKGLKVKATDAENLPILYIVCGMHAREWIGPAACSFVFDQLLQGKAGTQGFEWRLIPVINPDGYEYAHTQDRMWRKNRRNLGWLCGHGVDLERNFNWHSCQEDDETVCISQAYCGRGAKPSEPETQHLVAHLKETINQGRTIAGFVDIHSFSQLWMWPWGFTEDDTPAEDGAAMALCGNAAADALYKVHNTSFTTGPIASTIYQVGGSSVDWTYGREGIVHSYAVELRDQGEYGFLLPPEQIVPTGEELTAALTAMASCIAGLRTALHARLEASGAKLIF